MKEKLRFVLFLLLASSVYEKGNAQTIEIITSSRQEIPRGLYKSWSLFLVTNAEWLLPESGEKLSKLYLQFKAFGGAIGPSHLAVWFSIGNPDEQQLYNSVDVVRSVAFCERLKLPPGKGPYILITTEYPGAGNLKLYPRTFLDTLKNYNVIALGGTEPPAVTQLLKNLADTLVVKGVVGLDSHTEDYWRAWQKTFESMRDGIVSLSSKITFKVKTVFFEADIKF